jgi:hypothetical protein
MPSSPHNKHIRETPVVYSILLPIVTVQGLCIVSTKPSLIILLQKMKNGKEKEK